MTRRVAVTGLGVLCGYGRGVGDLWKGLASGRSAVREHRAYLGRSRWLTYPMAALQEDATTIVSRLPRPGLLAEGGLDRDLDFLVLADPALQALEEAGFASEESRGGMGLVVTHESPGLARHVQSFFHWREIAKTWWRSPHKFRPPDFLYEQQSASIYRLHSFLYVHYLSALFGIHGFTLYNNNACASGAFSLALAVDRIRAGDAEAMLVVGGDAPEDGTKFRWFRDLGLYSSRGACAPFRADRDGLVLGSAGAALVLEDLELARRAGKRIHAEWLGGGFSSEGWKVTLPDVMRWHYVKAIDRALKSAGAAFGAISLLVPHGVGTGLYDRFESACLGKVFGDADGAWPALMPLKGALGHTLGGCVLLEALAGILALEKGAVPPAARSEPLDPALGLGQPRDALADSGLLLKCTNGFAGQNGAIVLRAHPPC